MLPLPPFFVSLVYFVFLLSGVPNAVQVDDALFNYVDTALPFFQASADCLASYGGSLASIHSETENTAVYELNPTLEARWIGLYEASDVEDVFSWTDGTHGKRCACCVSVTCSLQRQLSVRAPSSTGCCTSWSQGQTRTLHLLAARARAT